MQVKITCPFSLPSSHEIHEVGFRGGNNINLTLPFQQEDFLGIIGTSLEINQSEDGKYCFVIVSDSLEQKEEQVGYLEMVAEYLSFLINRNERNPHYGTNFVQVEWFELKAIPVQENADPFHDVLHISDALAISSTREVTFEEKQVSQGIYHDILRFYFDGLRAEHKKSKYFHWFLILEYLENSIKYKELFNSNKLFDENEEQQLRDVANQMSDGVKKGAILNLLSRTKEFRNYKLLKMINTFGITNIIALGKTEEISLEIIKQLIDGRNSLFHSGSDFPELILWNTLFPLVTHIVEYVSCNQGCLDAPAANKTNAADAKSRAAD
ncbi:hypothetical protein KAI46_02865 [bacterium]|nr:hypothetical protein [bacterium]